MVQPTLSPYEQQEVCVRCPCPVSSTFTTRPIEWTAHLSCTDELTRNSERSTLGSSMQNPTLPDIRPISVLIARGWYSHISRYMANQKCATYEWKHFCECTSLVGKLGTEGAGQRFHEVGGNSDGWESSSKPLLETITLRLYFREMIQWNLKRSIWKGCGIISKLILSSSTLGNTTKSGGSGARD